MSTNNAALHVERVNVSFGGLRALNDVYLEVGKNEVVGLIGPNGAGKTTTLRTISGVRPVAQGSIFFEGEDITKMAPHDRVKRGICQAPEGRGIFPGMTVRENLDMGTYVRSDKGPQKAKDLEHVMHLFPRLRERIGQMGGTLSGGEKRRVALCRLLLQNPDILLLDEPTNHLDAESIDWLEQHLQQYKGTVIAVTHDRYFLDNVAKWILELDRGEGIPYEGNYASWLEQKTKRLAQEEKQASKRQNYV